MDELELPDGFREMMPEEKIKEGDAVLLGFERLSVGLDTLEGLLMGGTAGDWAAGGTIDAAARPIYDKGDE